MAKNLNLNMTVTADTSQAKREMKDLQDQLSRLGTGMTGKTSFSGITSEVKQATQMVAQLKAQLEQATNVDTGRLDWTKFNQGLKQSKTTLGDYRKALQSLGAEGTQAFAQLAKSIATSEVPVLRIGERMKALGTTLKNTLRWQISSSVLHGFMGAINTAYRYSQDLNESLNNIRIVTGLDTDAMAKFADQANKAAQSLGTSTTAYTDAALIYYQQGIRDEEQIKQRTEATIKLANVTKTSAQDVSSQLTAIWNNFAKSGDDLELYADKITALGAATASSSAEIAQGLEKFAAIADTVGLSYDYATAGLATVVAQTRQSADIVGTAFKTIFGRMESLKLGETLEDETTLKDYSKALQQVGVEIKDSNGDLRDMDDVLNDLGERWKDLAKDQQVALAQTVAGVRQYNQFIALLDNWDKVQKNVRVAEGAKGTLARQQAIYEESWESSAKKVKAAWEGIYQDLFNDKFFINLNNGLASFLKSLDKVLDNMGGVQGLLSQIAPIVMQIFSKEIITNMETAALNFKLMLPNGRQKMIDQRDKELITELDAVESRLSKTGATGQQIKVIKEDIQLEKTRAEYADKLNDTNKLVLNNLIEQVKERRESKKILEEEVKEAKKLNDESIKKGAKAFYGDTSNREITNKSSKAELERLFVEENKRGQMAGALTTVQNTYQSEIQGLNSNQTGEIDKVIAETLLNQINGVKTAYKDIFNGLNVDEVVKELKTIVNDEAVKPVEGALKTFFTNLEQKINSLLETDSDVTKNLKSKFSTVDEKYIGSNGKVNNSFKQEYSNNADFVFTSKEKRYITGNINEYLKSIENNTDDFKAQEAELEELKKTLRKLITASGKHADEEGHIAQFLAEETTRLKNASNVGNVAKNTREEGQEYGQNNANMQTGQQESTPSAVDVEKAARGFYEDEQKMPLRWSESVYGVTRAFMTLGSTISTVRSTLRVLTDEGASFGDKLGAVFQALITLGMQYSMLLQGNTANILTRLFFVQQDTEAEKKNTESKVENAAAAEASALENEHETEAKTEQIPVNNANTDSEIKNGASKKGGLTFAGPAKKLFASSGSGVLSGAGVAAGVVAAIVAFIVTFTTVLKKVSDDFEQDILALQRKNEENVKWFEDNKLLTDASSNYDHLNNQLKNNVISTEKFNESLVELGKQLGIAEAETAEATESYALLNYAIEQEQEKINKEAFPKANQIEVDTRNLMASNVSVADAFWNDLIGPYWQNFTGNYSDNNQRNTTKIVGSGAQIETGEQEILKKLADLNLKTVVVNQETGKVAFDIARSDTKDLKALSNAVAEILADAEKYGGDQLELIKQFKGLCKDWEALGKDFETAITTQDTFLARTYLKDTKINKDSYSDYLNQYYRLINEKGLDEESVKTGLSEKFSGEVNSGANSLLTFIKSQNYGEAGEKAFADLFTNSTKQQQELIVEALQKAPEYMSSLIKSKFFAGKTDLLKEDFESIQAVLDSISLDNFETTFSIIQETLDDLTPGQIFKTEKEFESFAKKFGTDVETLKKAYKDAFVFYKDGSVAFIGEAEKLEKDFIQKTFDDYHTARNELEKNKKEEKELLGNESYENYVTRLAALNTGLQGKVDERNKIITNNSSLINSIESNREEKGSIGYHILTKDELQASFGIEDENNAWIYQLIEKGGTLYGSKAEGENYYYKIGEEAYNQIIDGILNQLNTENDINRRWNDADLSKINENDANIQQAESLRTAIELGQKPFEEAIKGFNFANSGMNLDELEEIYQKARDISKEYMGNITDVQGAMKQASINTMKELKMTDEQIDGYVKHLKESVSSLKDASEDQIYAFAASLSRLQDGIQDLHDNWDSWSKALNNKNNEKYVKQYSDALMGVQKALKNIFDIDTNVDENFILNHFKDIKKAATGSKEAIQKLSREYVEYTLKASTNTNTIISEFSKLQGTTYNSVDEIIKQLDVLDDNFQFGMTLDNSQFLKNLAQALSDSSWSIKQINDLFASAQWKGELKVGEDGKTIYGFENVTYGGGKMTPTDKNKNKGKGKSRSKKDLKDLDDEFERYYTINRQIQDQEDLLNKLGKAKDRAWGKAKLDNIDKESKALKEQIKLYQRKQKEIESYYKKDQARMNYFGAKYDENGVITNYKEMQKRELDRYNAATKKYNKGQISEKTWQKADDRYKAFKEALKDYDDTNQLWQENLEKIKDLQNELYDKKVEKIETKIEMDIQVDDHELKILEYDLERIKKKSFSTAEAIAKMAEEIGTYLNEASSYKGGIKKLLKNHGLDASDISNLSDKEIANLGFTQREIEDLMKWSESLLEAQKAIDELEESILNGPLETMKEWNEEFDYQEQKIDNNINLLKQYQDIAELIYSNSSSVTNNLITELMESQYEQSISGVAAAHAELEANKKALADARAQYEASLTDKTKTQQNRDQLKKNLREMEEIVVKSEQDLYKKTEDTLKKARELFERAIKNAGDAFKEMVKASDWDVTKFDHLKELDKQYLDDYEKIYHLSKLTRDINNSIDDADTIRQKERLKEITQEIADIEESGREVSQYEVDALRKKYELRLAEIALEDAQAAKQTVRMSRDNDGNWSYVYTADDDNVDKMRQNYEDKLYEYQKLNSDFIKQQEEDFLKLQRDYVEAREKILTDSTLKDDERQAYLNEVDDFYNRMAQISSSQLGIAINKNSELYHKDWLDYSKNTDYKISKLEDYQSSIRFTYDGVLQPTIKDANQLLSQFDQAVNGENGYITKTNKALDDFKTKNKQVIEAAGGDLENFGKIVQQTMGDTEKSTKSAATEVEKDSTKMEKAFEKVIAAVQKLDGQKLSKIRDQNKKLIEQLKELIAKYKELSKESSKTPKTPSTPKKTAPKGSTPTKGDGPDDDGPGVKKIKTLAEFMPQIAMHIQELGNYMGLNSWIQGALGKKKAYARATDAQRDFEESYGKNSSKIIKRVNSDSKLKKTAQAMATRLVNEQGVYGDPNTKKFDTGGYTGSWGSDGRLAMLHQKELVLNAHDTENMLNTIQMVRDIVASIDTRAAAAGAVNINNAYANAATVGPQSFDQNVHIEANFPNATDHNEIELAISSLVNRASQYVGRKKL